MIILFKSLRNFKRRNKRKFHVEVEFKQDNVVLGWVTILSCFALDFNEIIYFLSLLTISK